MKEMKMIEVTKEEYEIILFYRFLTKEKKEQFITFLKSLDKLLKVD